MIDEDATHHGGRDGDEVSSALPMYTLLVRQPQIGFVNQGGRLEGVVGTFSAERPLRQGVQLVVDEGQYLPPGIWVSTVDAGQKPGDIARCVGVHRIAPTIRPG